MGNWLPKFQEKKLEKQEEIINQQEEEQNFTCEICIEPTESNKKFNNGNRCIHPFCNECVAKYIEAKLEENIANIKCAGLDCDQSLDPLSCMKIIPNQHFDKWCDLLCDSTVLGYERCYCPYQDCSALVLNECRDKLKKVGCPNCKKNFCFQCKIPWHAGYWCRESRQLRDANDVLVGNLIENRRWTRCYNCGHSVERVAGCSIIYCRCGATFCHRCGGPYHPRHVCISAVGNYDCCLALGILFVLSVLFFAILCVFGFGIEQLLISIHSLT